MKNGIDLVEVERFENKPKEFFEKIFTQNEIEYCSNKANSEQHFAGHFACKEAVMKVLGKGVDIIPSKDIEILHHQSKEPYVVLSGKAKKLFDVLKFKEISISISHTKKYATAICVAI